jgi:hypothetical protein
MCISSVELRLLVSWAGYGLSRLRAGEGIINIPDVGMETLGGALDANHLQAKAEIAQATIFLSARFGRSGRNMAVLMKACPMKAW